MQSTRSPIRPLLVATFAIVILLGACGSGGDSDSAPSTTSGFDGTEDIASDPAPDETQPDTTAADTTTAPADDTDPQVVTIVRDQELRVTESRARITCDGGGEIEIAVGVEEVEILGSCEEVEVDASGATVIVANTDDLDIDGNDNQVQASAVGDLDIEGHGNTVIADTVNEIDLDGNDNTVTWTTGSPEIDDEGSGNTVTQG